MDTPAQLFDMGEHWSVVFEKDGLAPLLFLEWLSQFRPSGKEPLSSKLIKINHGDHVFEAHVHSQKDAETLVGYINSNQ